MSSDQLALGIRERPTASPLEREARRLARPVLRAVLSGKIRTNGLDAARREGRDREHGIIECLARVLSSAPEYRRLSSADLGIEKDGVILAGNVAFKIGKRAELEANLYASSPNKRDILAEAVTVAPCIVAMERAIPLVDARHDICSGYHDDEELKCRMNSFTCDAHDGNIGLTPDGRYVLIDYSFDADIQRNRSSSSDSP